MRPGEAVKVDGEESGRKERSKSEADLPRWGWGRGVQVEKASARPRIFEREASRGEIRALEAFSVEADL